ncbi:MAG: hypothetical protein ACR2QM_05305 [Longimicrobiales bacterium]
MTDERRYQEDEVRQIFERAADARDSQRRALSAGDGLSLAELQEIGLEVGLSPERVAEAASALELRAQPVPPKKYLGMPLSVGRTVDLPRAPTDREWEVLVAELRETFQAKGTIDTHGGIRQWTNGNLHAFVEPTEQGHRLRLGSLKGNTVVSQVMGSAGVGLGVFTSVALLAKGRLADEFLIPLFFVALGIGAIAVGALALPSWAGKRAKQMDYIAGRAQALLNSGPEPEGSGG